MHRHNIMHVSVLNTSKATTKPSNFVVVISRKTSSYRPSPTFHNLYQLEGRHGAAQGHNLAFIFIIKRIESFQGFDGIERHTFGLYSNAACKLLYSV